MRLVVEHGDEEVDDARDLLLLGGVLGGCRHEHSQLPVAGAVRAAGHTVDLELNAVVLVTFDDFLDCGGELSHWAAFLVGLRPV